MGPQQSPFVRAHTEGPLVAGTYITPPLPALSQPARQGHAWMSPQKTLHCRHCVLGGSVCVGLREEEEGGR